MKNLQPIQRLSLFALTFFALFISACDPTDSLVVKDSKAVLQLGEQATTLAADGTVYRIYLKEGTLVAKPLQGIKGEDATLFSQFEKLQVLAAGEYKLELPQKDPKGGKDAPAFALVKGEQRISSNSSLGMMVVFQAGAFHFAMAGSGSSSDCDPKEVTFTADKVVFNGYSAFNFFTWESEEVVDEDGLVVQRRQLEGDIAVPTVPSDTGIEIVIVDTFTPETCCDETWLNCTEEAGEPVEADPVPPADGWAIASTHHIGHACVYEACGHVIVADQITGEIRCYNSDVCQVRIEHHHNGTFSVLLPSDCDTAACVTICPAK
jgi:hypothetical protein